MFDLPLVIEPETPDDAEDIGRLNERVFGPGRFARTAYRIRERAEPVPSLSFVARVGTLLVGANSDDADRHRRDCRRSSSDRSSSSPFSAAKASAKRW